jgi:hypothetical protein
MFFNFEDPAIGASGEYGGNPHISSGPRPPPDRLDRFHSLHSLQIKKKVQNGRSNAPQPQAFPQRTYRQRTFSVTFTYRNYILVHHGSIPLPKR